MHTFTKAIQDDMQLSLGVTEPGAIALAAAKARSLTRGTIETVALKINAGIYKNSFTCGIPNTHYTGSAYAAALGAIGGDPAKGLAALDGIGPADIEAAGRLVGEGRVKVEQGEISSRIYIRATVRTAADVAEVTIADAHTNIVKITKNGEVLLQAAGAPKADCEAAFDILAHTVEEIWEYALLAPLAELAFMEEAYTVNLALAQAGRDSRQTDLCKVFLANNGGVLLSSDAKRSAHALTAAAIEARVRGLDMPAMSITGSGNHGIICTLPLYACCHAWNRSQEARLRATAISYLVTMYLKACSGKLSAFCGCAIAAGTGMACGMLYLLGGSRGQAAYVIHNMAAALTGVICTGGNTACVLKAAGSIDAAFHAAELALKDAYIHAEHGINGGTPEETMQNMGKIASPGMVDTERVIVEILQSKG